MSVTLAGTTTEVKAQPSACLPSSSQSSIVDLLLPLPKALLPIRVTLSGRVALPSSPISSPPSSIYWIVLSALQPSKVEAPITSSASCKTTFSSCLQASNKLDGEEEVLVVFAAVCSFVMFLGIVTSLIAVSMKTDAPRVVMLSGKVTTPTGLFVLVCASALYTSTVARETHPSKAPDASVASEPLSVTLSMVGMSMNASSPMDVTVDKSSSAGRELAPLNAVLPIDFMPLKSIVFRLAAFSNMLSGISVNPPRSMLSSPESANTASAVVKASTESGISICLSEVAPENMEAGKYVMFSANVTSYKDTQLPNIFCASQSRVFSPTGISSCVGTTMAGMLTFSNAVLYWKA